MIKTIKLKYKKYKERKKELYNQKLYRSFGGSLYDEFKPSKIFL